MSKYLVIALFLLSGVAQADFITAVSKLNGLRADVEGHERQIKKLMYDKRRTEDPEVLRNVMAEIVVRYKDMEVAVNEYERLRARTKVRYPSRRAEMKKFHPRYQFRPLEQMMQEDGVPEALDSLVVFMAKQYGNQEIVFEISNESRGNIEGEMKAYQIQLRKQQSSFSDWSDRPVLQR